MNNTVDRSAPEGRVLRFVQRFYLVNLRLFRVSINKLKT